MKRSNSPLVTPKQLGTRLNVSSRQALRLPIPQVRLGPRTIRFREEDIDDFIDKKTTTD